MLANCSEELKLCMINICVCVWNNWHFVRIKITTEIWPSQHQVIPHNYWTFLCWRCSRPNHSFLEISWSSLVCHRIALSVSHPASTEARLLPLASFSFQPSLYLSPQRALCKFSATLGFCLFEQLSGEPSRTDLSHPSAWLILHLKLPGSTFQQNLHDGGNVPHLYCPIWWSQPTGGLLSTQKCSCTAELKVWIYLLLIIFNLNNCMCLHWTAQYYMVSLHADFETLLKTGL